MVASAPAVPPNPPSADGIEVKFIQPSKDPERTACLRWIFCPRVGPQSCNQSSWDWDGSRQRALDELRQGVSGTKFVIEMWLTTLVPVNINIHDIFLCYDWHMGPNASFHSFAPSMWVLDHFHMN